MKLIRETTFLPVKDYKGENDAFFIFLVVVKLLFVVAITSFFIGKNVAEHEAGVVHRNFIGARFYR